MVYKFRYKLLQLCKCGHTRQQHFPKYLGSGTCLYSYLCGCQQFRKAEEKPTRTSRNRIPAKTRRRSLFPHWHIRSVRRNRRSQAPKARWYLPIRPFAQTALTLLPSW